MISTVPRVDCSGNLKEKEAVALREVMAGSTASDLCQPSSGQGGSSRSNKNEAGRTLVSKSNSSNLTVAIREPGI